LEHIPGNAPAVEGLQRKLEPLFFVWPARRISVAETDG